MNRVHIAFKLRKYRPRTDDTQSIFLYVNLNGQVIWYSTNLSVNPSHWNSKKQEVYNKDSDWKDKNSQLDIFLTKAKRYVQKCNFNNKLVRKADLDKILKATNYNSNSYYDFVNSYILRYKNKYAYTTLKGFKTHIAKLKEFKSDLDINSIDAELWSEYETYLKGVGNKPNTIHKQYRLLKKFINKAIEFGIVNENQILGIKVKSHPGNREFLTHDEVRDLQAIYDQNVLTHKGQHNVLKYFLFACYTSLRYQDIKRLKYKNIQDNTLRIATQKTGYYVSIPLSNKALSLIDPETLPNDTVFNVYTNQVTNRHLKEIIKLANIKRPISFHCARNTWATITLEMTGDIALVSDVLGHTSIQTTQIYAKVLEKKKKEAMDMWDVI